MFISYNLGVAVLIFWESNFYDLLSTFCWRWIFVE